MPGDPPVTFLARLARCRARLAEALARRRVTLGFASAAIVFLVADPTWPRLLAGAVVALLGESIRMWAAGHLEKGREVTMSGPYRWVEHPLYIGSAVMAGGLAIASQTWTAALIIVIYVAVTIGAAIRTEEATLRQRFGETYEGYQSGRLSDPTRRFSLERARRNREPRAAAGLAAALGLLAIKLIL